MIFIILSVLAIAYVARVVVLPVLLAVMGSMMLKSPVNWLRQCRLPAPVASAVVVSLVVIGAAAAAIYLGGPAIHWASNAPDSLPRLKDKFRHVLQPAARLSEAASSVGKLAAEETAKHAQPVEVKDNQVASKMFSWTGSLLAGIIETIALLFLILASGDLFLQKLVRAMPRLRDKKHAVEISRQVHQSVSSYLFSVGLINLGLGAVVGFALDLIGMPNAVMWGGVAAFANFIPYLGPILAMAAVGVAGLLAFDTLGQGLLPAGVFCGLHLIESNFVTPFVLGRRFTLNPVMIFVALIFFTWLWGVLGALLAVPLLVVVKIVCAGVPGLGFAAELLAPNDPGETAVAVREVVDTPNVAR